MAPNAMNIAPRDKTVGQLAARSPRRGFDLVLFRIRRFGAAGAFGAVLFVGALLVQQWQTSVSQGRLDRP